MKRIIAILICLILIVSGCGTKEDANTKSGGVDTPKAEKLTVLVSSTTYSDAQKELYKGFTEATGIETDIQVVPGATAQFQQIVQSKLLTKDYPDILTYWGDPGILLQLQADQHMKIQNNQEWIDKVSEGIYEMGGTYKGNVYGFPISGVDFTGLIYNQDIFDELGLDAPKTYDELVSTCQKIVDSGKDIVPIYEMGKQGGPLQAFAFVDLAAHFITEDGKSDIEKLNSGELKYEDTVIKESYERKIALQDAGYMNDKTDMMTGTWDTMFEALANGKTAMSFVYSNILPNFYQSYPDANINMTALNGVASGSCTQYVFAMNTKNSAAQDAYFDYLFKEGVLEQYYNTSGLVAPYKGIESEMTQPIKSMFDTYKEGNFTQNYGDRLLATTGSRIAILQEMHVKTKTPEEACQQESIEYAKVMEERGQ